MPEVVPNRCPSTSTRTPWSPAAVDATCEPCPVPSRGERYSAPAMFSSPKPVHEPAGGDDLVRAVLGAPTPRPAAQAPWKPGRLGCGAGGALSARPLKLGLSGQMPVSTTPTTTPRPARCGPPCCAQAPRGPSRPSRSRELLPTAGRLRRGPGRRAAWCCARRADARRSAAEPACTCSLVRRGGEAVQRRSCSGRARPGRRPRAAPGPGGAQPRGVRRDGGPAPVEPRVAGRSPAARAAAGVRPRRAGPPASRRTRPGPSPERVRGGAAGAAGAARRDASSDGGAREQRRAAAASLEDGTAGSRGAIVAGGRACFNRNLA